MIDFDVIGDLLDTMGASGDLGDLAASADDIGSILDSLDYTDLNSDLFADLMSLDLDSTADWINEFPLEDLSSGVDPGSDYFADLQDMDLDIHGEAGLSGIYRCDVDVVPGYAWDPGFDAVEPAINQAIDQVPKDLLPDGDLSVIYHSNPSSDSLLGEYHSATDYSQAAEIDLYDHADQVQSTVWHEMGHHIFMNNPEHHSELLNAIKSDGLDSHLKDFLKLYPAADRPNEAVAEIFSWYNAKPEIFAEVYPSANEVISKWC